MFKRSTVSILTAGLLTLTACSTAGTDAAAPADDAAEQTADDQVPVETPTNERLVGAIPVDQVVASPPVEPPTDQRLVDAIPVDQVFTEPPPATGERNDPYLPGYRHIINKGDGHIWEVAVLAPGRAVETIDRGELLQNLVVYAFPVEVVIVATGEADHSIVRPWHWEIGEEGALYSTRPQYGLFPQCLELEVPDLLPPRIVAMAGATITGTMCATLFESTFDQGPLLIMRDEDCSMLGSATRCAHFETGTFAHEVAPSEHAASEVVPDGTGEPGNINNPLPVGTAATVGGATPVWDHTDDVWNLTATGPIEDVTAAFDSGALQPVREIDRYSEYHRNPGDPIYRIRIEATLLEEYSSNRPMDLLRLIELVGNKSLSMVEPAPHLCTATDNRPIDPGQTVTYDVCFVLPAADVAGSPLLRARLEHVDETVDIIYLSTQ